MTTSAIESSLLIQLQRVALDHEPPSPALLRALDEDPLMLQHAYRLALDIATLDAAAGGEGGASKRMEVLLSAAAERAAKRDAMQMPQGKQVARSFARRQLWGRWGALAAMLSLICTVGFRLAFGGVVAPAQVSWRVHDNSSLGTHTLDGSAVLALDAADTLELLLPSAGDAQYAYLLWRDAGRAVRHEAVLEHGGQFGGLRGAAARRDGQGLHLTLPVRHLPLGAGIALHIAFGKGAAGEAELEAVAQGRLPRSRALTGVAHLPPLRVTAAKR